ncbi:MAG: hypothetical protein NVSMB46_02110 [Candidatus Saccharimonadales bacterium]
MHYRPDPRPKHEHPEGSGIFYVQIGTFGGELPPKTNETSDIKKAFAWRKINRRNFISAEVDTGLSYVPLDNSIASENDFIHNGRALLQCQLEKIIHTKYIWLSKVVEMPTKNIDRPAGRYEPEHLELPSFESIVSRVYHEEIPRVDFQELIAEALPLNENFEELRTIFEARWRAHPIMRALVD